MKISAGLFSVIVSLIVFSATSSAQITFRSVDHVNHPYLGYFFIDGVTGVSNRGDIVGNSGSLGNGLGFRLDGLTGELSTYLPLDLSGTVALGVTGDGATTLIANDSGYGTYLVTGSTVVNLGGPNGEPLFTERLSNTGQAVVARSGLGGVRYRWTVGQDWQQLSMPAGETRMTITDINDDGSLAVGYTGLFIPLDRHAALWDSTGTPHIFDPLSGFSRTRLNFVNSDGTMVMGHSYNPGGGYQVFCWTEAEGIMPIDIAGGALPRLANSDLTTFVLTGGTGSADIWSQEYGFFDLHRALIDQGFIQEGWQFEIASLSPDGYSFGGTFRDTEGLTHAWSATIPSPPTAAAVIVTGLFVGRRRR